MKKLIAPGITLIVTQMSWSPILTTRPFGDHSWFIDTPEPFDLFGRFTLADGHIYGYRYRGMNLLNADEFRVALLSHSYPPVGFFLAGGYLFNYSVRGSVLDKFLIS